MNYEFFPFFLVAEIVIPEFPNSKSEGIKTIYTVVLMYFSKMPSLSSRNGSPFGPTEGRSVFCEVDYRAHQIAPPMLFKAIAQEWPQES
jgi:hypothetical protein